MNQYAGFILSIQSKNHMKRLTQTSLILLSLVNIVVVVVCADTYRFAP